VALSLTGCGWFWDFDTYWRSERYILVAVDTKPQMSLAFDVMYHGHKGSSSIGLVGPTVFELGADDRFIVAKQHPALDPGATKYDRAITNYFVVTRTSSLVFRDRKQGVVGPLTASEFERMAKNLKLPPFSVRFDDLD